METPTAATSDSGAQAVADPLLTTIVPLDPSDDDVDNWFPAEPAPASTSQVTAAPLPLPTVDARADSRVDAPPDGPVKPARRQLNLRSAGFAVLVILVVAQGSFIAFHVLRDRTQARLVFFDAATVKPSVEEAPAAAPTTGQAPAVPAPLATQGARQDPAAPHTVRSDGRLTINSDPTGVSVSVDGRERGITPLTVAGLAPGTHRVVLDGEGTSVTQLVKIAEGASVSVIVPFTQPALASGWIAVAAPFDIQVFEGGRLLGVSQSDRIMVPTGLHRLDLVNSALGYRTSQQVQVQPGRVASIAAAVPTVGLNINALPWAEVFIDGERVGETPLANVPVRIGPHKVVLRHPEFGSQTRDIVATAAAPTRVSVDFRP